MTARRQPSATSLSQFARSTTPDQNARSYDYCNSFWGIADGGVDVLFARMRGAARTVEELRNFWKERALIEEEFAKRLAKLSKTTVGRDEIGEFRNSIDSLRTETEKQSSFHLQLAQQIRNDLEAPATAFVQRQLQHRKTIQAQVEKQFKNKQAQEAHVNKAREKYEQDCLRINSFTAQSSLVQGKDLERITLKLEKAQQTVQANERDFANFARALQDTVAGWEQEWKNFCDTCQDLEDERMEFTKDNIWAYANAVSTVCVSDDESCERLRLALEQFEPEKDQESFVAHYGTGNQMPDPPQFVSYSQESSLPSINAKPTTHPASFTRNTQRVNRLPSAAPPPQDEEPAVNMVGVGAGNRASVAEPPLSRAQSRTGRAPEATQAPAHVNGAPVGSSQAPASSAGRPGSGSMVDPTTMLVVGSNAYPVDPSKNPQQQAPQHGHSSSRGANNVQGVGDESDPMYRAMAELRNTAVVGRSGTRKSGTMESGAGASASSPPRNLAVGHNPNRSRDYRNSAELIVGSHPAAPGSSRPTSPSGPTPPSAALMKPPTQPPAGVIDSVMGTYHQSFPNEIEQRRSRPNSRRNSFNIQSQIQAAGQQLERPVSREGHAGIGANGRSASPSLQQPPHGNQHRGVSPSPSRGTSPAVAGRGAQQQQGVGIMLDPNGNVSMDAMADAYQQRQPSNFQPQVPPPPPPIQPQQQVPPPQQYSLQQPQQQVARRPSISNTGYQQQQGSYVQSPSRSYGFQPPAQAQQQQPVYAQQPQQQQQPQQYGATSPHPYAAAQPGGYNAPPPQQQPQQQYAQQQQNGVARANTMNRGAYYGGHQGYGSQPAPAQVGYGGYGGTGRSPSPQPLALQQPAVHQPAQTVPPTRQYTEDGRGVLFYVKALYDYNATIPEEFDFQQGDIIAVTATPEDGWWSGELLDEARRVPGRHIFPSNFVHLF